jgi:SHS2 domain-containing protein
MEEKYQILEHRADLRIMAFGKTKRELFSNMLLGMSESQKTRTLSETAKREVKIESLDFETLLVDFLSEALYQSQVNREVYKDVRFKKFTDTEIKGLLIGQKIESFGEDIKAVTYHGLNIQRREDGLWEATVLFDI